MFRANAGQRSLLSECTVLLRLCSKRNSEATSEKVFPSIITCAFKDCIMFASIRSVSKVRISLAFAFIS